MTVAVAAEPGPPSHVGRRVAGSPAVPAWLVADSTTAPAYEPSGRRRRVSFVDRTLDSSARVVAATMLADADAPRGLLHRLDPRAKLVALLLLLVALALVRHPVVLLGALVGVLLLARLGGVGVRSFVARVGLTVPAFTAVVVAPAMFSVVLPGDVVLPLWTWHGTVEGLTAQGLTSAALLVTRVACATAVVVLVTATTGWTRLLAALGALGLPRMLVMVVAMAYRYVLVLAGTVNDLYTSRRARSLRPTSHGRAGRAVLGASAGALVTKAHHLSDEVHQAMVARGYRGRARTLHVERLTRADLAAVAIAVGAGLALLVADGLVGH